jgi:hypothetical protein
MAAATLLTRVSGYWLMGHIPMTRRVRRCLEMLPGAIMAATVVPIVAKVGRWRCIAVSSRCQHDRAGATSSSRSGSRLPRRSRALRAADADS